MRPCNCSNYSSIHGPGVCCRLVDFLLNLKVKIRAGIVRLSYVRLAELVIFFQFLAINCRTTAVYKALQLLLRVPYYHHTTIISIPNSFRLSADCWNDFGYRCCCCRLVAIWLNQLWKDPFLKCKYRLCWWFPLLIAKSLVNKCKELPRCQAK